MHDFDSWISPAQRAAIEANSPSGFKSVRFITAEEKAKVLAHWRKLMKWLATNGVPSDLPKLFTEAIYNHLITHTSGYIAHYHRPGYWDAQLGTPAAAMAFFNELEQHLLCRWGALADYADVNEAMMDEARAVRPEILRRLALDDRQQARAEIAALAARAGFAPDADVEAIATLSVVRRPVAAEPTAPLESAPPMRQFTLEAQAALF